MRKLIFLGLLLVFSVFGSDINIEKIYAKESIKSTQNSAVFMNIRNNLDTDIRLIRASSSVADSVELHDHKVVNGMMMMSQIDKIEIKNNQNIELKPGGLHIMLIGLKKQLVNGDKIDIMLEFDTGKILNLKANVVNSKQLFLEL